MSRIELSPGVLDDFDRILAHLLRFEAHDPQERIDNILQAIEVLATSPLIGRPVDEDLRELVIDKDAAGYLALYHYAAEIDVVFVLALEHQREGGYAR